MTSTSGSAAKPVREYGGRMRKVQYGTGKREIVTKRVRGEV